MSRGINTFLLMTRTEYQSFVEEQAKGQTAPEVPSKELSILKYSKIHVLNTEFQMVRGLAKSNALLPLYKERFMILKRHNKFCNVHIKNGNQNIC